MITISLCMIVKNEEKVLTRCLDTVADLVDEIIIVDTGSDDRTREIAARYTDKIYDFVWINDFSAARNFAFSKATQEYIYSADADEVLDECNRQRFRILKETLFTEIELVQMKYANQLSNGSVYNFDEEYRPKLFKRHREFIWEGAIHETIRTAPMIYDSDVVITHLQEENHASRDLFHFKKQTEQGVRLNKRLHHMYATELYMAGSKEEIIDAASFFMQSAADVERDSEEVMEACLIAAKAARLAGDPVNFLKYTTKLMASQGNSEICCELGSFYEEQTDYEEAIIWYFNAAFETEPILCLKSNREVPLEGLVRCYEILGMEDQAEEYRKTLRDLGKDSKR